MTASANKAVGFEIDIDVSTGLTFGVRNGAVLKPGGVWLKANPQRVTMCNSASNFIEVDVAGLVSVNQTGFTAGRSWLYMVPVASSVPTSVQDWRGVPGPVGGAVTQQTDKGTAVTLNAQSGAITMNNAELAAAAEVAFTVNNTFVRTGDTVQVTMGSVGTTAKYLFSVTAIVDATSFDITVANPSAGALSEAIVLNFRITPGSTT